MKAQVSVMERVDRLIRGGLVAVALIGIVFGFVEPQHTRAVVGTVMVGAISILGVARFFLRV